MDRTEIRQVRSVDGVIPFRAEHPVGLDIIDVLFAAPDDPFEYGTLDGGLLREGFPLFQVEAWKG